MKFPLKKYIFIAVFMALLFSASYVAANRIFVPLSPSKESSDERKNQTQADQDTLGNESSGKEYQKGPGENAGKKSSRTIPEVDEPVLPQRHQAQDKKESPGLDDLDSPKRREVAKESDGFQSSDKTEERKDKSDRPYAPGETISLARLGDIRKDVSSKELVIPENIKNMNFLTGGWSFDHLFEGADGEKLRADFFFDKDGNGYSLLKNEKGEQYLAQVSARAEDGLLKINTTPYASSQSKKIYGAEFIECRNGAKGAECGGTDGFAFWNGERLVRSGVENSELMEETKAVASSEKEIPQREDNLAELSDGGAQLSPIIVENTEKAKAGASGPTLASLNGDWRFSHDLAKQSDGSSLSLWFHFDKNGKGYSVIKDNSGQEFRAQSEAELTKNGSIRVRTDAYQNDKSQEGFFPSFMECTGSEELACNLSNGWTRINDGRLLSAKDIENEEKKTKTEDIRPIDTTTPNPEAKRQSIQDILAEMSNAQSASPAKNSEAPDAGKELSLSNTNNSLSFLEGAWRCNTGLVRTTDNEPVVVDFSFDRNGKGEAFVRELSGQVFQASAQATLKNSILRINTSDYLAKNTPRRYEKSFIECKDSGDKAICSGKNGGISWSDATFIRLK